MLNGCSKNTDYKRGQCLNLDVECWMLNVGLPVSTEPGLSPTEGQCIIILPSQEIIHKKSPSNS